MNVGDVYRITVVVTGGGDDGTWCGVVAKRGSFLSIRIESERRLDLTFVVSHAIVDCAASWVILACPIDTLPNGLPGTMKAVVSS